ncbi:helix-turn-helix transcriptional regulator [Streptomyces calidiresistens]|uniref:Helix-turn-helix domain-containing protein n=1 Tax=Streptomyces calidiresistens TaxID=1485586 RepID=A0A7W3XVA3_9ACTN|nr:helix-turn-helix transcriptional regulator [Streptomyces calidiresistens]MBB0228561.1 helix-turn-helix domain-containing protein [Streptomyces calidiresistens]
MVTVQRWTGREARLLREALRMTLREFAAHLGVSDRAVSKWEAGADGYVPRSETQALLDTALTRSAEEVRTRFAASMGGTAEVERPTGEEDIHLDSHKFVPAYIGPDRARALLADLRSGPIDSWLESASLRVEHPDARTCTLHIAACGTALFHIVQERRPRSLTELAVWRYRSYASDLPWTARALGELLGDACDSEPEYVLSLYWLHSGPWAGQELHAAVRLLSTPSVLVDRGAPEGPAGLGESVEKSLMASGFDHPEVVPFGVRGVSVGYAGWSGVAYAARAPERSLTIDELVACELSVQTLWCYSRHIQRLIEDGGDPSTPDRYGWRFLRAAYSRLTTARPRETAQHCLMREAIVRTSGLAGRLREAQDALRESAG